MKQISEHWDAIFLNSQDEKLGWYEKDVTQTLKLLEQIPNWKSSSIFLPGAGTSTLIEELLFNGAKLILNDISSEALKRVKTRFTDTHMDVSYLCQDIAQPIDDKMQKVDLWIDRAVLHFLNDEKDIKIYFENLKALLNVGGYSIFAEFSKTGASKCAGLDVNRYSVEEMSEHLGTSFRLVSHFEYTYITPSGDPRPYVYALYKRES